MGKEKRKDEKEAKGRTSQQQEVPKYELVRGFGPFVCDEREIVCENAGLAPRQPHHHVLELRWCQGLLQSLNFFPQSHN